ncbi:MAG: MGH1-like glycoside hydrolase domain-containing protein [Chloroflexota bacterium]
MSPAPFSHPPAPFVDRNPYRSQRYQRKEIPSFQEARQRLPEPVLPQYPAWVEMYWRGWELAWQHLRRPPGDSGLVSDYMHDGVDDTMYMWNSAFMTHFGLYGRRAFDFLGTLDNFYARQHDDGFICRAIDGQTGADLYTPFDPNGAGPNVLGWSEWRAFRHSRDEERLARVFWPLLALHHWFRRHRTWPNGLYWATGVSSGMESQPRAPGGRLHHAHWTWIDANLQASLNCWSLAQMAQMLDEGDLAGELNEERAFLQREVNARLWNEDARFYQDVDPAGNFSRERTIGAYWALLDKEFVPEARLIDFLRPLREAESFNRPHRIPSLPADSESYDAGAADGWLGGVWAATNYMVLKGLRRVGQAALAHQIAMNHLENVGQVFEHTDTFWEYYRPETAAPGEQARPHFVGPTGLSAISVLLEDVIGISVDWPLRNVVWDRRLPDDAPHADDQRGAADRRWGVRGLPLGEDGLLDLLGDRREIEVRTTVPVSLTVRYNETELQTAVPSGLTVLALE